MLKCNCCCIDGAAHVLLYMRCRMSVAVGMRLYRYGCLVVVVRVCFKCVVVDLVLYVC